MTMSMIFLDYQELHFGHKGLSDSHWDRLVWNVMTLTTGDVMLVLHESYGRNPLESSPSQIKLCKLVLISRKTWVVVFFSSWLCPELVLNQTENEYAIHLCNSLLMLLHLQLVSCFEIF